MNHRVLRSGGPAGDAAGAAGLDVPDCGLQVAGDGERQHRQGAGGARASRSTYDEHRSKRRVACSASAVVVLSFPRC